MTNIVSDGIEVNTVQSSSVTQLSLLNGGNGTIQLPSPLLNTLINLNYTLAGTPVLSGVTGAITFTGQYKDGPIVTFGAVNLAINHTYAIVGKYTKLHASLSGLTGADTVIIYADQDSNNILSNSSSGGDVGAIALTVISGDSTIIQNGASVYNPGDQTITIDLSALGGLPGIETINGNGLADQLITAANASIVIDNVIPGTTAIKVYKEDDTVSASSTLDGTKNYIQIDTNATTQELPLISSVPPLWEVTFTNLNIVTTDVVPQAPNLLNGGAGAQTIAGAYTTRVFYASTANGWLVK